MCETQADFVGTINQPLSGEGIGFTRYTPSKSARLLDRCVELPRIGLDPERNHLVEYRCTQFRVQLVASPRFEHRISGPSLEGLVGNWDRSDRVLAPYLDFGLV